MSRDTFSSADLQSRLVEALGCTRPAKRTSALYRLALSLQAVLVVTLPLLYFALVGAVAWSVWWYATNVEQWVPKVKDKGDVLARYAPIVIGSILVFFLLKPLLAPRGKHREPNTLSPRDEPLLFAFVAALAERVGAPMPSRIDVDLQVNASASFARGLRSFGGGDLALTLGLPLVAGMDARQMTAVLAHEFGHFAQGAGMRSYYLTATIHQWLARVAYERDAWDERLERASNSRWAGSLVLVLWIARAGIWLSRQVLVGLLRLGDLSASWLSRQMEFDADRNAVRIVGQDAFASSMKRLPLIEVGMEWADHAMNEGFQEGRLPADYPALVCSGIERLNEEQRTSLVQQSLAGQVSMYATHPPMGKRIEAARNAPENGAFEVDLPATAFFRDFGALSRQLSERMYRDALGEGFAHVQIIETDHLREATNERDAKREAWSTYFRGVLAAPGLASSLDAVVVEPADAFDRLAAARRAFDDDQEAGRERQARLIELRRRAAFAQSAQALRADKIKLVAEPLDEWKKGGAEEAEARAKADLAALEKEQDDTTYHSLRERLAVVAHLLRVSDGESVRRQVFERHLSALRELHGTWEPVLGVQQALAALDAAWPNWNVTNKEKVVRERVEDAVRSLRAKLQAVREAARDLSGFREHSTDATPLREYLVQMPENAYDLGAHYGEAERMLESWYELVYRNWCEVAAVALAVEAEHASGSVPGALRADRPTHPAVDARAVDAREAGPPSAA